MNSAIEKMLCHKWRESSLSCEHGLYCIKCIGLSGWCQVVRHRPLPRLSNLWMLMKKKICRWKASVCSLAVKFCGSFLAMHIIFFPNLWYSYSIYTFFYCTGGVQINSSLLYPADSCSNLKECLNKICTLPCHLSSVLNLFLLLSWSITRLCSIVCRLSACFRAWC